MTCIISIILHDISSATDCKSAFGNSNKRTGCICSVRKRPMHYESFAHSHFDTIPAGVTLSTSNPVVGELREALQSRLLQRSRLLTVYLTAQYLWFIPWDPGTLENQEFISLMDTLTALYQAQNLQPSSPYFSQSQLCIRCLLERLWQRLGRSLPTTYDTSSEKLDNQTRSQISTDLMASKETMESQNGERVDLSAGDLKEVETGVREEFEEEGNLLDIRLIQLCCPILDQARASLKVNISSSTFSNSCLPHWQTQNCEDKSLGNGNERMLARRLC